MDNILYLWYGVSDILGIPVLWNSKTLWVKQSIRYYSRSAKSVGNFHGYNVTRIICDRVSVDMDTLVV